MARDRLRRRTYYDFDMFQEMEVTTGGADADEPDRRRAAEHGAQARHQHAARRRAHLLRRTSHAGEQHLAGRSPPRSAAPTGKGNRTDKYEDYGFELGGPILKDHLWGWGTIGKTDVESADASSRRLGPDTILKNYALKVDGAGNAGDPRQLHVLQGQQDQNGRSAGADASAGNDVRSDRPDQGSSRVKATSSSAATCSRRRSVSHVDGGFELAPEGGLGHRLLHRRRRRVRTTRTISTTASGPQDYVAGDGNYFPASTS